MNYSNLSKIKPKFRTTGNITGNFGNSKVKAGSQMSSIGMTSKENIRCASQAEYLECMYKAFDVTEDKRLKDFIYMEIKKILVQRGEW